MLTAASKPANGDMPKETTGNAPESSHEGPPTASNASSPDRQRETPCDGLTSTAQQSSQAMTGTTKAAARVSAENEQAGAHLEAPDIAPTRLENVPVMIATEKENGTKAIKPQQSIKSPTRIKRNGADTINGTPIKRPRLDDTAVDKTDHSSILFSPVKEITIVHHHHNTIPNDPTKKLRKAPDDLDEETMRIMLTHLKDNAPRSHFNDEEITVFMLRMNRASDRLAEHQHSLHGDSDESDTSLFNELLAEEEEVAIGQAYFKEVVANIRKETDYELDPRTLGWIRRAAGLHRSKPESMQRDNTATMEIGKGNRAVKTRRSTRQQKIQRRDKGIHLLAEALDDIEDEIGKFAKVKINIKRKRELSISSYPEEEVVLKKPKPLAIATAADTAAAAAPPPTSVARKALIARIFTRDVLANGLSFERHKLIRISRIIVNGSAFGDSEANGHKQRPLSKDTGRQSSKQLVKRLTTKDLCLKRNFWKRSRTTSITATAFDGSETKESYAKIVLTPIPPAIKAAGIQFCLPRFETLIKTDSTPFDPPRQRHSDDAYASLCLKLVRSMTGSSRSWAMREFFYSDIDREWFSRNDIREEVSRLGLSQDVQLTSSEWKVIRRQVKGTPRRFSHRFVESQLERLRKYRARVRLLQNNATSSAVTDTEYDVPALIPFGTIVTAYSTKYDILLRGVVLTHEPKRFAYVVLYDRKEFGCELCVDYNVATHGGPVILIPRRRRLGKAGLPTSGTSRGAVSDTFRLPRVELQAELQKSLVFDPYPLPTDGSKPQHPIEDAKTEAIRQAAENEALTGLLAVIQAATRRKEMLLAALEEANAIVVSSKEISQQFRFSCGWLKRNLSLTDHVLEAALPKLRLMYGRLYMPSSILARDDVTYNSRSALVEKGIQSMLEARRPSSQFGKQWSAFMVTKAAKVSKIMASAIIHRARADKRAKNAAEDLWFTEYLLGPVGSMLVTASYGHRFARVSKVADPAPLAAAIAASSRELVVSPDIHDVADADDLYVNVQAGHAAAAEDLKAALSLWHTEIVLATAQQSLEKESRP